MDLGCVSVSLLIKQVSNDIRYLLRYLTPTAILVFKIALLAIVSATWQ